MVGFKGGFEERERWRKEKNPSINKHPERTDRVVFEEAVSLNIPVRC